MTGLAVTDLLAQRDVDRDRVARLLGDGLTMRQIARRLGFLEHYADRLVRGLERQGRVDCICGRWLPRDRL